MNHLLHHHLLASSTFVSKYQQAQMRQPTGIAHALRVARLRSVDSIRCASHGPDRSLPLPSYLPSRADRRQLSSSFSTCKPLGESEGREASFASTSSSAGPSNSPPASSFSTINASEISHFSRLSSEWWNPNGEFKILHRMNPARVAYVREKVALAPADEEEWTFETRHKDREREAAKGRGRWLAGKRVLDVGCGGGLLSEVSPRLLKLSRRRRER